MKVDQLTQEELKKARLKWEESQGDFTDRHGKENKA